MFFFFQLFSSTAAMAPLYLANWLSCQVQILLLFQSKCYVKFGLFFLWPFLCFHVFLIYSKNSKWNVLEAHIDQFNQYYSHAAITFICVIKWMSQIENIVCVCSTYTNHVFITNFSTISANCCCSSFSFFFFTFWLSPHWVHKSLPNIIIRPIRWIKCKQTRIFYWSFQ